MSPVIPCLEVIPSLSSGKADDVLETIQRWFETSNIEISVHTNAQGHSQLTWPQPSPFDFWPDLSPLPCSSLLGEYVLHQIAPLCPAPVELSAGLYEPMQGQPVIHLPWPEPASGERSEPPAGNTRLLSRYRNSALSRCHRHYYATEPHPPECWAKTYDRIQPSQLPACVLQLLKQDAQPLAQWVAVKHFTRSLLALGWHPRHIAGILWSRWSRELPGMFADPLRQADHVVRCCVSFLLRKLDKLSDFDCNSVISAGLCPPNPSCPVDLETLRQQLRTYDN